MVGAGKHGLAPKFLDVAHNPLIISGHHHAGQVGLAGLHHHALNHTLAAQVDEWFAGQAGGSKSGGNQTKDHEQSGN
ncbi:hypothetical protein GCM10022407_11770 [Hymenobacter antarcticus]|uniref:Uncharacterized protein n=1 Tax=Hymenobacter antarcticus TaxID=486270 RepID=A0ABP7PKP1_9BACT